MKNIFFLLCNITNKLITYIYLDDWCTTGKPFHKRLLLADYGIGATERFIIFSTDQGLKNLTFASTWYMDGNFALAPKQFHQLYVIRV